MMLICTRLFLHLDKEPEGRRQAMRRVVVAFLLSIAALLLMLISCASSEWETYKIE